MLIVEHVISSHIEKNWHQRTAVGQFLGRYPKESSSY